MDRQLPDGYCTTRGRVNSCKVQLKVGCFTLGQTSINPSIAWKKADVFKINGDDDDDAVCAKLPIFFFRMP